VIPVINKDRKLVGFVTYDDLIN